jgi:hypothetical protein
VKLYFARHGESEANVQWIFWDQSQGYGLTDRRMLDHQVVSDGTSKSRLLLPSVSPCPRLDASGALSIALRSVH